MPKGPTAEGIFLLTGADRDTALAQGIFQQIIERLPPFQHSEIASDSELENLLDQHAVSAGLTSIGIE